MTSSLAYGRGRINAARLTSSAVVRSANSPTWARSSGSARVTATGRRFAVRCESLDVIGLLILVPSPTPPFGQTTVFSDARLSVEARIDPQPGPASMGGALRACVFPVLTARVPHIGRCENKWRVTRLQSVCSSALHLFYKR